MVDFVLRRFVSKTCCCRRVAPSSSLILIGWLRVMACLGAGGASGFAVASGETVAVGEFAHQDIERNDPETVATLSAAVQAGLDNARRWNFVDRQETDRVLAELALGQRGFTLSSNSVRAGKLLKADILLTGTIFTPAQAKPFIVLETTELARAEPIAQRRIELGPVLERGRLMMPSADDIRRIAQAGGELLDKTHASLAAQASRTVIKPLFFVNASDSQRLDGSEHVFMTAIEQAAAASGRHRILTLERPEAATSESELILLGLVDSDLSAWSQVADYYIWGAYREKNTAGRELPDVDVEVSVTVWDGRHAPSELSETGKVRELPQLADRIAAEVLAATAIPRHQEDQALGSDQRKKVSAMLAERARKIRDTEIAGDQAGLAVRRAALNLEKRRILAAAIFFSPAEKEYWQALQIARYSRTPRASFTDELRECISNFYGNLGFSDRFLITGDGRIDSELYIGRKPAFDLPREGLIDPDLRRNLDALGKRVDAAYAAWTLRTARRLASTSSGQEEAYLGVAQLLVSETLSQPFDAAEREEIIAVLSSRLKIAFWVYRAWYPNGDTLGDLIDRLCDYYYASGQKEQAEAMRVLTPSELAAAEQMPPPVSSPGGEALGEMKRLTDELERRGGSSAVAPNDWPRSWLNAAQVKYEMHQRRALAFLRAHRAGQDPAAASFQDLLEGPHQLSPLPKVVTPAGKRWQATWLRATEAKRAEQGYPETVRNRMRALADALEREAEAATQDSTGHPANPLGDDTGGGGFIFNPFVTGPREKLDGPYHNKLPSRFASLTTVPLSAVAWKIRDRDPDPDPNNPSTSLYEVTDIVPWSDDLWIIADRQLWRHRPADGAVEEIGQKLGIASHILCLMRAGDSLWIGTEEEGVWRIDPPTLSVRRFGLKDGLQSLKVSQLACIDGFVYAVEAPAARQVMVSAPDYWALRQGQKKALISRFEIRTEKWTAYDPFPDSADRGLPVGFAFKSFGEELFLQPGHLLLNPRTNEIRRPAIDLSNLYRNVRNPEILSHHYEFVDQAAIWIGSGAALLNFNPSTGVTSPAMETPAFSQITTDGRYLYCYRPADLAVTESSQVDESPAELFVFDRARAAWIGRVLLEGRASCMTAAPGRLWIGRKNHPRALLEVDLRQLEQALTTERATSAVVAEPNMPVAAAPSATPEVPAATTLFMAAWRGDCGRLQTLLAQGADPNQATPTRWTPLLSAIRGGHAAAVELLLQKGARTNVTDTGGWYPLRLAYERNDRAIFDLLLTTGNANVNFDGSSHESVLHLAVKREDAATIRRLLLAGANPGLTDAFGRTPIQLAQRADRRNLIALFANPGAAAAPAKEGLDAPLAAMDPEELKRTVECYDPGTAESSLAFHVWYGDLPTLRELFARGAPVEAAGFAMATAIYTEQWPVVNYLQAQGYSAVKAWPAIDHTMVRMESTQVRPSTLILWAALLKERTDLVKELLASGITLERNPLNRHLISRCLTQRNYESLGMALRAGADPNSILPDGFSPLYHAIRTHDLKALQALLAAGADANAVVTDRANWVSLLHKDSFKKPSLPNSATAFDACAMEDWIEGARALLSSAKIGLRPDFESHAYLHASLPAVRALFFSAEMAAMAPSSRQPPDGLELLTAIVAHDEQKCANVCKRGKGLEARGIHGESALMLAIAEKAPTIARRLLDAGAPVNDFDPMGATPLAYGAQAGDVAMVQELAKRGADPNLAQFRAARPLDYAIFFRDSRMALALLALGASPQPHRVDDGEVIPLFMAATHDLPDVVRELIRRGENPRQLSSDGFTAFFPAASSNDPEMIQLFLNEGVNLNQRSPKDWTPLMSAVCWGAAASVRKLVALGLHDSQAADLAVRFVKDQNPPNRPQDDQLRALHYVPDYLEVLRIMQTSGQIEGSREAQDSIFWDTPHSEEEIEAYLKKGGTVNHRAYYTPLQTAILAGDEARVKFLLAKGADANLTSLNEFQVPLSLAMGKPEIVKLLLQGGANPNALYKISSRDGGGAYSILTDAIERNTASVEAVRLLVQYGADPRLCVRPGLSTWEVLEQKTDWPRDAAQRDELRQALSGH